MNIIVLIKQVPNTSEVRLDPKTGNLVREGIESIINPDDRDALEAAVRIREEQGGRVTVVSMGPNQAIDAISEAMGLGADEGVLLTDRAFAGADTWATSTTLGKAVEKIGKFDLILCGRQAIDGDTAQIGPQVAEYLGVPQVTYVFEIEKIQDGSITVKRRLEDGHERIQCSLPALLTTIGGPNKPRLPRVDRVIDACSEKAHIRIWNAADLGVQTRDVGLEGSLTNVIKTFAPKSQRQGEMLEGDSRTAVRTLIEKLRQKKLI
jgi:electron transfer flavoprotein beta subunit